MPFVKFIMEQDHVNVNLNITVILTKDVAQNAPSIRTVHQTRLVCRINVAIHVLAHAVRTQSVMLSIIYQFARAMLDTRVILTDSVLARQNVRLLFAIKRF